MKPLSTIIRTASVVDTQRILEIYEPYVLNTPISFELSPPDYQELSKRILHYSENWAWLVAEINGVIAGYAYGSAHRPRAAYQYSVEVSAYIDPTYQRRGLARLLYQKLFKTLEQKGYSHTYAAVTLPNAASVGFHLSQGFAEIGTFPNVGFKFEKWHSVAWFYRPVKL